MIVALLTGRKGSKSIKDKNVFPILGKPMTEYPLAAAKNSKLIDKIFISTDCEKIATIGEKYGAEIIWRPKELCEDDSLHEDAIAHGYEYIKRVKKIDIEIIVILLCNCVTILSQTIDNGINDLRADKKIDSCVTVSEYSEYNIARAMKIENNRLENYLSQEEINNSNCDRNSMGPTYFCDSGAYICRPKCMNLEKGKKPFRWIGKNVKPIIQESGLDVDNERGIAIAEYWLKKYNSSFIK